MKNLLNVIEVAETNLHEQMTEKSVKQNRRNELKSDISQAMLKDFEEQGFQTVMTNQGVVLMLETNNGIVSVVVNPIIKNLSFDPKAENEIYKLEQESLNLERELKEKIKAKKGA